MTKDILIYCDLQNPNFIESIFPNHTLSFQKIDSTNEKFVFKKNSIVIVSKKIKKNFLKKIQNNNDIFLILHKSQVTENKLPKTLSYPLAIDEFKDKILNFLNSSQIYFDIRIDDDKLTNINNKRLCHLTQLERELLLELLKYKKTEKRHLEDKVLKININVETQTLISHLSRIRKKLKIINSKIQIKTKKNQVVIFN